MTRWRLTVDTFGTEGEATTFKFWLWWFEDALGSGCNWNSQQPGRAKDVVGCRPHRSSRRRKKFTFCCPTGFKNFRRGFRQGKKGLEKATGDNIFCLCLFVLNNSRDKFGESCEWGNWGAPYGREELGPPCWDWKEVLVNIKDCGVRVGFSPNNPGDTGCNYWPH